MRGATLKAETAVEAAVARRSVEVNLMHDVEHVRSQLKSALVDVRSRAERALTTLARDEQLYANGVGVIQGSALQADLYAQRLETMLEQVRRMVYVAEVEAYAEQEVARG